MGKATIERRKAKGLCISCGKPCDRLPLFECTSCSNNRNLKGRGYYRHNRARVLKRTSKYYEDHKEEYAKWRDDWYAKHPYFSSKYNLDVKLRALQIVSKKTIPTCSYCDCDDIRFLEINHINGGGAKEALTSGTNFYWSIFKGRRKTDDLEVACGPHNRMHYYKLKYGDEADRFVISWTSRPFASLQDLTPTLTLRK